MKLSPEEKRFLQDLVDRALTYDITVIRWNREKLKTAPEPIKTVLHADISRAQKRIALAHKTLQKL